MSEVPQRIGDAERDQAVAALQSHHAAGRLDLAEFDERLRHALAAKTNADLAPLFADLPSHDGTTASSLAPVGNPIQPSSVTASHSPDQPIGVVMRLIAGLMWPAVIIINLMFGFEHWWLFLIPVFVTPAVFGALGRDSKGRKRPDQLGPTPPPSEQRRELS